MKKYVIPLTVFIFFFAVLPVCGEMERWSDHYQVPKFNHSDPFKYQQKYSDPLKYQKYYVPKF